MKLYSGTVGTEWSSLPDFRLADFLLSSLTFLLLFIGSLPATAEPSFIGSSVCADCHTDAADAWLTSDHANAWTLPDESTVLGDFNDVAFQHGGRITRFLREGEKYLIETEGPDGQRRAYEVVGVAGIDPLQQYLLSPEPGRTQTYDVAWDVEKERWYPVFPNQISPPSDGFHWTGPYKSWEARCAECHATGYSRNYDLTTNAYSPVMAEIGVGCEACHGPGSTHVAWARLTGGRPQDLPLMGLTVDLTASRDAEVMQCLTCHSRRESMQDGNPLPGTDYHDSFSMTLLRDGVYHSDGSILDEVFEGGSFLQSKMFEKGVRCSTCHEPHSATLLVQGNALCTQCHSPVGNIEFPTLALKNYDHPEHHFHSEDSEGAQCISCHMIERVYMGVDARRDHSFRVPRPDLASTGSPDACTDCHADRDAAWAAEALETRFPNSTHRGAHFATTFAAARRDPGPQAPMLLNIAEWQNGPGIVRASALELLDAVADQAAADRVIRLLSDSDPLVRAAAASALRSIPPDARLALLEPVLTDPMRAVREAAAKALADARPEPGTSGATALNNAREEWSKALMLRADFPETHLQIGGAALQARDFALALTSFERAVTLDPQLVEAWSIVVRLHAALGNADAARRALLQAQTANPGNEVLQSLR